MFKVWGRRTSSNTQKVVWALEELALPYERVDAGGPFGGLDTPAYRTMNPNGLVPVLQDGDFLLWESNAILRYLATVHGAGRLLPDDPRDRACADQWMDWQQTVVAPAYATAYIQLIRTLPEKRDLAAIEVSRAATVAVMRILDAQLEKTGWVAGPAFSIADIALAIMAYRFWQIVPDRPPLTRLRAWYDAIEGRPAFRSMVSSVALQ